MLWQEESIGGLGPKKYGGDNDQAQKSTFHFYPAKKGGGIQKGPLKAISGLLGNQNTKLPDG